MSQVNFNFIGFLSSNENQNKNNLGTLHQLNEVIEVYKIDEVIFCAKNVAANTIIDAMLTTSKADIEYKIAPEESVLLLLEVIQ